MMKATILIAFLFLLCGKSDAVPALTGNNKFARKASRENAGGYKGKRGLVNERSHLRGKSGNLVQRRAKKQKKAAQYTWAVTDSHDGYYDGPDFFHPANPPLKKPKKFRFGPWFKNNVPKKKKKPSKPPAGSNPDNGLPTGPYGDDQDVGPGDRPEEPDEPLPDVETETTFPTTPFTMTPTLAPSIMPTPGPTNAMPDAAPPTIAPSSDAPVPDSGLPQTASPTVASTTVAATSFPAASFTLDPTPAPSPGPTYAPTGPTNAPPDTNWWPSPPATPPTVTPASDAPVPDSAVPQTVSPTVVSTTGDATATPTAVATEPQTVSPTVASTTGDATATPTTVATKPRTEVPTAGATATPTIKVTLSPTMMPPPSVAPVSTSAPTGTVEEDTEEVLVDLLKSLSRTGGVEFDDPSSYQSIALAWLNDSSEEISTERKLQRYVLACIYYATNGVPNAVTGNANVDPWGVETNWLTNESECDWFGINCDDEDSVISVDLYSNNMTGSFPSEIVILKEKLIGLDVFDNMLLHNLGEEGTSFLGELTNLNYLMLGDTSFEYNGIPPGISQLTDLVDLDVSYTYMYGELDGSIFTNMNRMEYLVLSGNQYNSPVPPEIARLPSLQFLYIEDALIDGDLSFIDLMGTGQIAEIWVNENPDLVGPIPSSLSMLDTLAVFSASECGLSGPIPPELGSLQSIEQLTFFSNSLTGNVPSELGQLVTLEILELDGNLITGSVPSEICEINLDTLTADCDAGGSVECACCTTCY